MNISKQREAFEKITLPHFPQGGDYDNAPIIEDHWQTFQEGWEAAIEFIKSKTNPEYTDIISDGKTDPRNK